MANLATLVEYERLHEVQPASPVTGKPIGVKINVVSADSKRVTEALREVQQVFWTKMAGGGTVDTVEAAEARKRAVLIACIDSWDWGEHEWNGISGTGAASLDDRIKLVDDPNAKWLTDPVLLGTESLVNFTNASPETAKAGSKKA